MSNHSGSYMLNEVLFCLEDEKVFETLGQEATHRILGKIVEISDKYDCNSGEILEEIGPRIGFCPCCLKSATEFMEWGTCIACEREQEAAYREWQKKQEADK